MAAAVLERAGVGLVAELLEVEEDEAVLKQSMLAAREALGRGVELSRC